MANIISGRISQVIGPVVDISFDGVTSENDLPGIHEALEIRPPQRKSLTVEVQEHIGENSVRTLAMDSTDGQIGRASCRERV